MGQFDFFHCLTETHDTEEKWIHLSVVTGTAFMAIGSDSDGYLPLSIPSKIMYRLMYIYICLYILQYIIIIS